MEDTESFLESRAPANVEARENRSVADIGVIPFTRQVTIHFLAVHSCKTS